MKIIFEKKRLYYLSLEKYFPFFCGFLAFLFYELSNATGLFWGDGGEFIAVAKSLGIGHSYGHPLFWLTGRVLIYLYPGDPATAMNLLTTLSSAGTCIVIAYLAKNWCSPNISLYQRLLVIFCVTGIYATLPVVWSQATFIEVYNFQALFLSLAIYGLDRYFIHEGSTAHLCSAAFFWGLSLTLGMYVSLVILLPVSMLILAKSNHRRLPVPVGMIMIFFLLGISVWLYLPIRSLLQPAIHVKRFDSLATLLNYLGRESYTTRGSAGAYAIPTSLFTNINMLCKNLGIWGIILLVFSFQAILKNKTHRKVIPYPLTSLYLLVVFSIFIPLNLTFRQMIDMDVYFIPAFIVIVPALTIGAGELILRLRNTLRLLIILPVLLTAWARWENLAIPKNNWTQKFTTYLTSNLPPASTIIPVSDEVTYPLYYSLFRKMDPKNYQILTVSHQDSGRSKWAMIYGKRGLFIEINDSFLEFNQDLDNYCIAGPFLLSVHDSLIAQRLESEFVKNFSFNHVNMNLLHKLDRLIFGMLWSRRGIFWFHVYKNHQQKNKQFQTAYKHSLKALYKAYHLDHTTYSGALHASNLSLVLIHTNALDKAIYYARQAIRINPCSQEGYRNLYTIALKRGNVDEALHYLQKLTKLSPKKSKLYFNMATLYYFQKKIKAAKEAYDKGIQLGGKPSKNLERLLFEITAPKEDE